MPDQTYTTPIRMAPLEGPDGARYQRFLRELPDQFDDLIAGLRVADFLNATAIQFGLTEQQRDKFARFILDGILGFVLPEDLASSITDRLGVKHATALQLLKELETFVRATSGLAFTEIARFFGKPELLELIDDRAALRYSTLEQLMADVEKLPSDERMPYLQSIKKDNRILVLKAFSQLKLDTDKKGRPLAFSVLVDREAGDFSARDWVDIAAEGTEYLQQPAVREALMTFLSNSDRLAQLVVVIPSAEIAQLFHAALQEALGGAKPALVAHVRLSPYFAGVFDREQGVNAQQFAKFAELPDEVRQRLVSADMSGRIGKLVQEGVLPEQYAVAVAKTVFLVEVGDVPAASLGELFGKRLGLTPEQGSALAKRIRTELLTEEPAPDGRESPLVSVPMEPIPGPIREAEPDPAPITPKMKRPERSNVVDLSQRS